ncbi:MAG: ABC transporter permease [Spirochaetaceae bacterium]|jgi:simple sugar transport system permease protein|nr:ABC transporter permease [Spirochaetaceae bacterium]
MDYRFPLLHSAVTIMTPLLLAASGGLFTELAGTLNIALEGLLLTGAFAAIVCAHFSGSILGGVLGAICSSLILSAFLGLVTLKLRANVFIAGLAANLFASGLTVVLSFRLFGTRGVTVFNNIPPLRTITLPVIDRIPIVGDLLSGHSWFVYLAWALLLVGQIVLSRTPFGFRLRACEGHAQALVSMGLKPGAYRFAAFLISGLSCGIGGSFLTLNLGAFVPNISSGKGWIALVVIFLGNRRPQGIFAAALVFGLAEAFSNYAQGSLNVPADFILAIPYLFTLLLMTIVSIFSRKDGRGRE